MGFDRCASGSRNSHSGNRPDMERDSMDGSDRCDHRSRGNIHGSGLGYQFHPVRKAARERG